MKDIKNVLICGIGAVGSIYANKIQNYDAENLRVLVDKQRYERYIKNTFHIFDILSYNSLLRGIGLKT